MLLTVLLVSAVILAGMIVVVWLRWLIDERRRIADYASTPAHVLVARARTLLEEGDPEDRSVARSYRVAGSRTSTDFDPRGKNDLLEMLSHEDYEAMLRSRRGGGWWYVGPYDLGPEEDIRRMDLAHKKNKELRLILISLSRRRR
jgi:hypothetical protein